MGGMGGGVQLPQRTFNCNGVEALNLPDRKIDAFRVKNFYNYVYFIIYIFPPSKTHLLYYYKISTCSPSNKFFFLQKKKTFSLISFRLYYF